MDVISQAGHLEGRCVSPAINCSLPRARGTAAVRGNVRSGSGRVGVGVGRAPGELEGPRDLRNQINACSILG